MDVTDWWGGEGTSITHRMGSRSLPLACRRQTPTRTVLGMGGGGGHGGMVGCLLATYLCDTRKNENWATSFLPKGKEPTQNSFMLSEWTTKQPFSRSRRHKKGVI